MSSKIKITILIALISACTLTVQAQQKPILSQYMLNHLVLNPAYAGRHEYSSFTGMFRSQWVNVPGAPTMTTLTGQTGFKDRNIGVGALLSVDQIGVHQNTSLFLQYAYNIKTANGATLSMGLQGGMDYLYSNFDLTTKIDPGDPYLEGSISNIFPNFGTGLFYFSKDWYLGFSVPYILTNRKLNNNDLFQNVKYSRNYYITGGMVFQLSPMVAFKPSGLVRVESNMPISFDVNMNFYLDNIVGIGGSYRYNDSFIALLELRLNDFFRFSYTYDILLSDLNSYSYGSHELMLNYRINFFAPRKHRMCPGPLYF